MLYVPLVEQVGKAVFVGSKATARLQNAERLGINTLNTRRTADRLDGIDRVVTVIGRIDAHEVTLKETQ